MVVVVVVAGIFSHLLSFSVPFHITAHHQPNGEQWKERREEKKKERKKHQRTAEQIEIICSLSWSTRYVSRRNGWARSADEGNVAIHRMKYKMIINIIIFLFNFMQAAAVLCYAYCLHSTVWCNRRKLHARNCPYLGISVPVLPQQHQHWSAHLCTDLRKKKKTERSKKKLFILGGSGQQQQQTETFFSHGFRLSKIKMNVRFSRALCLSYDTVLRRHTDGYLYHLHVANWNDGKGRNEITYFCRVYLWPFCEE